MADQETHKYYDYDPSLAAAIVFTITFAACTAYHIFKVVQSKTWYFTVFIVGGVFEVIGYIGRIIGATETPDFTIGPYILQTLLILLAPPLFAASMYMTLGRLAGASDGEQFLLIRRTWLTKVFVVGDVLSFLMQAAGGGMMAGDNPDQQNTGETIAIAGLIIQLVFFGCFIVAAIILHVRAHRHNLAAAHTGLFRNHMIVMYAASVLIFIRSIVRTIEWGQGLDGYIASHEVFLYVFDAVMMTGVMAAYILVHPSTMARLRATTALPVHSQQPSLQQLSVTGPEK